MKSAKKPYWKMNTEELREATREFDRELIPDDFHPLGPKKRAIWDRLQSQGTESAVRVRSVREVRALRERVKRAGKALAEKLEGITSRDSLKLLKDFKLLPLGRDPYDPSHKMNFVEQINQSATLLVACAAVECLFKKHPSREGYWISRPTAKGYDLWAVDVSVAGEVFAATSPGSNRKLGKDLAAVLKNKEPFTRDPPRHRYVFFVAPSLAGVPRRLNGRQRDPAFGDDVWYLTVHERRSVTVVRLPEESAFSQ